MIFDGSRLTEYFMERVQSAILHQDIDLSKSAEFYLVNLLTAFERTDKLSIDEPLALKLARAMDGDISVKIHELKNLGDVSLYVVGFFEEHIGCSLVDAEYYIDMGSSAYGSLAGILAHQKTFADVYDELSKKFLHLANVLGEVSMAEDLRTNTDILQIYERWLRTGDEKFYDALVKQGVTPAKKVFC